jgi:hypothetical protein
MALDGLVAMPVVGPLEEPEAEADRPVETEKDVAIAG